MFKRGRIWQVAMIVGDILHRRTTGRRRKNDAREMVQLWKRQLTRRGKPTAQTCRADQLSKGQPAQRQDADKPDHAGQSGSEDRTEADDVLLLL